LSGRFQSSLIITVLNSATETAARPFDNAKASRLGGLIHDVCFLRNWRAIQVLMITKLAYLTEDL
jgi:hypothetical protein